MSSQISVCVFGSLASEPVVRRRLFTLRGSGSRLKGAYGDLVYPPNTCPHALSYFPCQKFLELSITRLQVGIKHSTHRYAGVYLTRDPQHRGSLSCITFLCLLFSFLSPTSALSHSAPSTENQNSIRTHCRWSSLKVRHWVEAWSESVARTSALSLQCKHPSRQSWIWKLGLCYLA